MTCIACIQREGKVIMASDKMITFYEDEKQNLIEKKIFRSGDVLVGSDGSLRISQLISTIDFSNVNSKDYIVFNIVPQIYNILKKYDVECVGSILIATYDSIYIIDSSLAVIECRDGFYAIGSGGLASKASLFSTKDKDDMYRIKTAMECSSYYMNNVSKEYDLILM